MSSRHYGPTAYVVHVWGRFAWQHLWKIYGTESVAKVQALRMVEEYWRDRDGNTTCQSEIFPIEGKSA